MEPKPCSPARSAIHPMDQWQSVSSRNYRNGPRPSNIDDIFQSTTVHPKMPIRGTMSPSEWNFKGSEHGTCDAPRTQIAQVSEIWDDFTALDSQSCDDSGGDWRSSSAGQIAVGSWRMTWDHRAIGSTHSQFSHSSRTTITDACILICNCHEKSPAKLRPNSPPRVYNQDDHLKRIQSMVDTFTQFIQHILQWTQDCVQFKISFYLCQMSGRYFLLSKDSRKFTVKLYSLCSIHFLWERIRF